MTCRDFSDGSSGACTTDSTTAPITSAPTSLSARAATARVAPVVKTSSTSTTWECLGKVPRISNCPRRPSSRSRRRRPACTGGQRLVEATEQDGTTMLSAKLLCHFGWQVKTPAGQTSGIGWNRHQGWLQLPDAGSPRVGHEVCEAAPSSPPWAIFRLANGLGEMGVVPTC